MSVFTNPASTSTEQAAAYTAAVLALVGKRAAMEVLESTATALEQALKELSQQQLT